VPPSSSGSSSDLRVTTDNKHSSTNTELQNNMTLFSKTVNTVETLIAPGAKRLADWWYGPSKPKHEVKGPVPNEEVICLGISANQPVYNTINRSSARPSNTMCCGQIGIGDVCCQNGKELRLLSHLN